MTANTGRKRARIVALALLLGGTAAYAAAQQHSGMHSGMHEGSNECMQDGMSCPMEGMHALADVKIENTKNGAVIRLDAKKADQVAKVQALAERMKSCMGMDMGKGMGMGMGKGMDMNKTQTAPNATEAPHK